MTLGLELTREVEYTLRKYMHRAQKRYDNEPLALYSLRVTKAGNFKASLRTLDGRYIDLRYDKKEHRWRKLNKLGQW